MPPAKKKTSKSPAAPETAQPYLTEKAMKFLRDLKRNNRREWFEARREIYEQELKQPMLALVEKITQEMMDYAPGHMRSAQKIVLRIYRDTRFSPNKTPYKTHVSAWWTCEGLDKNSAGGYYLQISPQDVTIAAGVYMPPKEPLFAIRKHLREHHETFGRLIEDKKLRKVFAQHDPLALTRPPKGFNAEEPGIEWIRWRQWGIIANFPAEIALKPTLAATVGKHFRLAQPLVDFLNTPLHRETKVRKKPLFALY